MQIKSLKFIKIILLEKQLCYLILGTLIIIPFFFDLSLQGIHFIPFGTLDGVRGWPIHLNCFAAILLFILQPKMRREFIWIILLISLLAFTITLLNELWFDEGRISRIFQIFYIFCCFAIFEQYSATTLNKILQASCFSLAIFGGVHLGWILFSISSPLSYVDYPVFHRFWGLNIYQGYISYPTVLFLALLTTHAVYLKTAFKIFLRCLIWILLIYSMRKSILIFLVIYGFIFFPKKTLFSLPFLLGIFLFFFKKLSHGIFLRLYAHWQGGELTSYRPDAWGRTLKHILHDPISLLIGPGSIARYSHNYFLTVITYGGIVLLFFVLFLWIRYYFQFLPLMFVKEKKMTTVLFIYFLIDGNINSPFTQMYISFYFSLLISYQIKNQDYYTNIDQKFFTQSKTMKPFINFKKYFLKLIKPSKINLKILNSFK